MPGGSIHWEQITAYIVGAGMEDMSAHFLLHHKSWVWYGIMWYMRRLGMEMRSRADYLLGTNIHKFRNVSVLVPHYN